MARTEIPHSDLVANGDLADPAGTTLNAGPTNGHFINRAEPEKTVLRITTNAAGGGDITLAAGDNPPALASGQGSTAFTVAESSTVWLGPFESGRYLQNDGQLLIDVAAGAAGTITAFRVPRNT